ncbi:MAG: ABC transporter ATP-binding protein, partial [Chloroflexi bacterium]|nr:ABC transporter ATP-binding protein [Chloroflexota bacterium]
TSIDGEPPLLIDPPPGCSLAPRCSQAKERCLQEEPPELDVSDGHTARCWLGKKPGD